ncbi:MAG: YraN family protein [Deltaproteobacteria bacterium]|nr:YraN family protein [Deltaproteobacteria bacterium]
MGLQKFIGKHFEESRNSSRKTGYQKLQIGKLGEKATRIYLENNDYQIISENWRCRAGEIDIVAIKENTLSFIEVKTRSRASADRFSPFEAVDYKKERKIRRLAEIYLHYHAREIESIGIRKVQYDIAGALYRRDYANKKICFEIRYLKEAFTF